MAFAEHLKNLRQGVAVWNAWRQEHPDIDVELRRADLREAKLSGANLSYANLAHADLSRANLSQANLYYANLRNTILEGTDLAEANLGHGDFTASNLDQANLMGSNLANVNFIGTHLEKANLDSARLGYTVFSNVDLGSARGLECVRHSRPSTIGIDTLYRSNGLIPEVFLRGAGVPDSMISYAKSLVASPIEYYSLFISYSTADQDFAERLHADLQAKGIRCWFAPHDIQGGKKLHEQIDEAIRLHDKLLLILSPNSIESEWVKTEIAKARKREVWDKARVLFPVRLVPFEVLRDWECFDADTGKDSAREIREYFIPDFSNWKDHDSYRTAFDRLVKDLQAPAGNGQG